MWLVRLLLQIRGHEHRVDVAISRVLVNEGINHDAPCGDTHNLKQMRRQA